MAYVIGAPDGLFRASGAVSVKHAIACAHSFNIINRLFPLSHSLFERRKTNRVFPFEYIISKSYIHHATFRQNPTKQQNIASERATTIQVTIHEWARFFEKKRKTLGFEDFFPLGALGRSGGRLERSTLVDWNEEKAATHSVTTGRWSRCAQCTQGHQSITTREPVLFRFAMGSRIVLFGS